MHGKTDKFFRFCRYAPVAQLDRVLPSDGKGCGFDSHRVYQTVKGRRLCDALLYHYFADLKLSKYSMECI